MSDQILSNAAPPLLTGQKWTPSDAVQQATSALRHRDTVGQVQQGRRRFGLAASKPTWRANWWSRMCADRSRQEEDSIYTAAKDAVGWRREEKDQLEGSMGN